jgi:hypothetical protein
VLAFIAQLNEVLCMHVAVLANEVMLTAVAEPVY